MTTFTHSAFKYKNVSKKSWSTKGFSWNLLENDFNSLNNK